MAHLMGWCMTSQHGDACRTQYVDWIGKDVRCDCPCHAKFKWDEQITLNAKITAPTVTQTRRARFPKARTTKTSTKSAAPTAAAIEAQAAVEDALASIETDERVIAQINEEMQS